MPNFVEDFISREGGTTTVNRDGVNFGTFDNRDPLISHDTTVNVDPNSARDALGLPTDFIQAASFGRHTANTSYPVQRRFRVALGVRW